MDIWNKEMFLKVFFTTGFSTHIIRSCYMSLTTTMMPRYGQFVSTPDLSLVFQNCLYVLKFSLGIFRILSQNVQVLAKPIFHKPFSSQYKPNISYHYNLVWGYWGSLSIGITPQSKTIPGAHLTSCLHSPHYPMRRLGTHLRVWT